MTDISDRITNDILLLLERLEQVGGFNSRETAEFAFLSGQDFHYVGELSEAAEGRNRFYLVGGDSADAVEAQWPIDTGIVTRRESGAVQFARVTTCYPADVRGKVTRVFPRMVRLVVANCMHGDAWTQCSYFGLVARKWMPITAKQTVKGGKYEVLHKYSEAVLNEHRDAIDITISAALTERYSWHAGFGVAPDGARILLPTTPAGARGLFKDRDIADGRTRREALRHWVSQHYRETGKSLAFIPEHLRGMQSNFVWRDLQCELLVSEYDIEQSEFFRTQASEWRAKRQHNSVRLRKKAG